MIRLTNLADYAVVLMGEMVRAGGRMNAHDLAGRTGVPEPTVSKILGQMKRAELLVSTRGIKGGFSLSRPADQITVADIIEAVDGPIALTACVSSAERDCSLEPVCAMRIHWQTINDAVRDALAGVSLEEISTMPAGWPDMEFTAHS
ncbi:MAG: SUF system Fe-S cluster assembly regulator [Rhodothalassiaceae bacterium]